MGIPNIIERMQNEKGKSRCATCGYSWITGRDGSHYCPDYMAKTIAGYRQLLIKYVAHVGAAEGIDFATSTNIAPCNMLSMEFTEEEKRELQIAIYPQAKAWDNKPT